MSLDSVCHCSDFQAFEAGCSWGSSLAWLLRPGSYSTVLEQAPSRVSEVVPQPATTAYSLVYESSSEGRFLPRLARSFSGEALMSRCLRRWQTRDFGGLGQASWEWFATRSLASECLCRSLEWQRSIDPSQRSLRSAPCCRDWSASVCWASVFRGSVRCVWASAA